MRRLLTSIILITMAFSTEWHSITTENPTAYSKEVISNNENATTIKFTLNGYFFL